MPRNDESRGVSGALRSHWRAVLGELVATALLVLLGVSSCIPSLKFVDGEERLVGSPLSIPALAFGFVVVCLIQVFGDISGAHMNPAITLASAILGRTPLVLALAYLIAQLVGGTLGFAALMALTPQRIIDLSPAMGVTLPARGVSDLAAVGVEAGITGLLVLLACSLWTKPHCNSNPIKFGLTIAGLVCVGGEMTGASLNPARSFGPALVMSYWSSHWVYWVGPLLGAAVCTLLHRWVLAPDAHVSTRVPTSVVLEDLPLNDKTNV